MFPALRWASPVGVGRGCGPGAGAGSGGRRGGGPLSRAGKAARLVLQRLLLEEAVGDKMAGGGAGPCRAPGGSTAPRPGGPEGGHRGQVTLDRAVGAAASLTRPTRAHPTAGPRQRRLPRSLAQP